MRSLIVFWGEFPNEGKLLRAFQSLDDLGLAWVSVHIISDFREVEVLANAFPGKPIFVFGSRTPQSLLEKEGWLKLAEQEESLILMKRDSQLFFIKEADAVSSLISKLNLSGFDAKTYGKTVYLFPCSQGVRETIRETLFPNPEIFTTKCHALIHLVFQGEKDESQGFFQSLMERVKDALKEKVELFYLGPKFLWQEVGEELLKRRIKVGVAESLTGGLISHLLTETPGASNYFYQGLVTYRTESKSHILGIGKIIEEKGVISGEVALEMARKARELARAEIGIGITGLAGPGGGSVEIPVGTVFLGVVGGGKEILRRLALEGNRQEIRLQSACWALLLLKMVLEKL
ncbi:MAG: CinA family protein [bacterium]